MTLFWIAAFALIPTGVVVSRLRGPQPRRVAVRARR